jgi:16S rRNA (guanine966-N2)-methyltransferase
VLDAFAGTGSIGLEAISRGAKSTTFIERDIIAAKILSKNVTTLAAEDQATIIRTSVLNWIENSNPGQFDLIFADPPYQDLQLSTVTKLYGLLKPGGLMILSHPGGSEVPAKPGVVVVDNRSYGNADLTFYRRKDA